MAYLVQEQLKPHGLKGISDDQIEEHWALYKGYVGNTNGLLAELAQAGAGTSHWAELKRRAGFEWNGMVLHEYYFGNLAAGVQMNRRGALAERLAHGWRTVEAWQEGLGKTRLNRGDGRSQYITAFMDSVSWGAVQQRFADSRARKAVSRFAAAA